jgi:antitoxin HicB
MIEYPVRLTREGSSILVSFPDFPDIHTFGDDEDEALARAVDALESYLMAMIEDRKAIAGPSRAKRGQRLITLPALTEAKIELYRQMRASGVGKAELARRLHCHLPQIDRLLNLNHASRLDQIEQALLAVGKRLTISFEDAA